MNKIELLGRLTKDPEVRYTVSEMQPRLWRSDHVTAKQLLRASHAAECNGLREQRVKRAVWSSKDCHSSDKPMAIARYTLAVNRRFKRDGEPEADFIPCVAFNKLGEFAEKYLSKGQLIAVVGRLQVRNWEDKEGNRRTTTEVIVEEQHFAESKKDSGKSDKPKQDFYEADEDDADLPF